MPPSRSPETIHMQQELCDSRKYRMLHLYSIALLAVIVVNVVIALLAANIASRRMHHD